MLDFKGLAGLDCQATMPYQRLICYSLRRLQAAVHDQQPMTVQVMKMRMHGMLHGLALSPVVISSLPQLCAG
jgi:hypothetical protein